MEQDDAKIAASWWSGTAGQSDQPPEPPPAASNAADWDALREKFVSTRELPEHEPGPRRGRPWVRVLVLFLMLGAGGAALVALLAAGTTMPDTMRNVVDALLTEAPVSVPAEDAAPSEPAPSRRTKRPAKGSRPVAGEKARAAVPVQEEGPFTIEVIDRNRRTIVHAYAEPMPLAIQHAEAAPRVAYEVPDLVIEETITPEGVTSRTVNVGASIVLAGTVTTDGRMRDVRVVHGPAEFVPAALEAVRRWRFNVLRQDGIAVERPARVTVNMAIRTDGGVAPDPR